MAGRVSLGGGGTPAGARWALRESLLKLVRSVGQQRSQCAYLATRPALPVHPVIDHTPLATQITRNLYRGIPPVLTAPHKPITEGGHGHQRNIRVTRPSRIRSRRIAHKGGHRKRL
jgi:hypothetical protein